MPRDKEYRFRINAYTPETIPMERLAEYMRELAIMVGETKCVHFVELLDGSLQILHRVEGEAVPKVEARLKEVRVRVATSEALRAYDTLNSYLRDDAATATFIESANENEILEFPGAGELVEKEFGPFNQPGTVDGVVIKVGGKRDRVPVHLLTRDGQDVGCVTTRAIAMELAHHLYGKELRLSGTGRWFRDKYGSWVLRAFSVVDFKELDDRSLIEVAAELSAIEGAGWKSMNDPWSALREIRGEFEDE